MGKLPLFLVSSVPLVHPGPSAAPLAVQGLPCAGHESPLPSPPLKERRCVAGWCLPSPLRTGLVLLLVHFFALVRLLPLLDKWLCRPSVSSRVCPPTLHSECCSLSHAVPFLQLVGQLEPLGDSVGNKWILRACARRETKRDFISISDTRAATFPFLART